MYIYILWITHIQIFIYIYTYGYHIYVYIHLARPLHLDSPSKVTQPFYRPRPSHQSSAQRFRIWWRRTRWANNELFATTWWKPLLFFLGSYPLVNKHSNGKSTCSRENTSSNGPFSIAMLDYRSVDGLTSPLKFNSSPLKNWWVEVEDYSPVWGW